LKSIVLAYDAISSLYYKHTMIVNYASSVIKKLEALLTDDGRVIIYDHHLFIVQATDNNLDQLLIFICTEHSLILISTFAPLILTLALHPFNYKIQHT
jgi:hypothetical protein